MRILPTLLTGLALLLSQPVLSANSEVTRVRYAVDGPIDYPLTLLQKSLEASTEKYGPFQLERSTLTPSQGRIRQLVADGQYLDLMFAMSNAEIESELLAVPFPLMRGLLGYRLMLTTADKLDELEQVSSLAELTHYRAVQGGDWADTDILRANGLPVETSSNQDSMFRMLKAGRVDYFPRGIAEIWSELLYPLAEGLVANKKVVLRYSGPYYILVSRHRPDLKERIQYGLMQLHASGEFERFFRERDEMRQALEFLDTGSYRIIDLAAPTDLPSLTEVPAELWYQPSQTQP